MNRKLIKLIKILSADYFTPFSLLEQKFNLSELSLFQSIKLLNEYGIKVIYNNIGCRLEENIIFLDPKKIKPNINTDLNMLEILETVDSTNDFLKRRPYIYDIYQICISEHQSSGKARLDRKWYSPFGLNIYLSLKYNFPQRTISLSGISLAIGLGIIKCLNSLRIAKEKFFIKWPNDIYFKGKKIAGILTEIINESDKSYSIIIGIGLNVNMHQHDKKVNNNWTSMKMISTQYYDRNVISTLLINQIIQDLETFYVTGLDGYLHEWKRNDYLFGKKVKFVSSNQEVIGSCVGIDKLGRLLIMNKEKQVNSFCSGDILIM